MEKLDRVHRKLKKRKHELFQIIHDAKIELEEIRKQCKHPQTFKGRYEWAPGHGIDNATICSVCGEYLAPKMDYEVEIVKSIDQKEDK